MGRPVSIPHDVVQPLSTALGFLLVNWALMEQALVMVVAVVHPGKEQKLPGRPFAAQIKFLDKSFAENGPLRAFREEWIQLVEQMNDLKSIRDDIVHGALTAYDPDGHKVTFTRLDADDSRTLHEEKILTISAEALLAAGGRAVDLTTATQQFACRLMACH